MAIVRLITCNNLFEAHQVIDKLEEEGIPCFKTNENFSSLMPNFAGVFGSGVHIMIEESDLDKAKKVITPEASSVHEEKIVCPECHSMEIAYSLDKALNKVLVILLSLLVWIPFGNIKRTYCCKECGNKFAA